MNDIHTPVFLVASVRSGSTLLGLMLNSHESIVNPGECDFFFDLMDDDGSFPDIEQYREYLKHNRIFQSKKLSVDQTSNYAELVSSFVAQLIKPNSVIVLNAHHNFSRIPKLFPHAKFIHLARDGRDVARSCIGMNWAGNVYYGIDIWLKAENEWERLKATLSPSQYFEIKYEELLEDIEFGLGQICQFIGLAYSKSMMDYASETSYSLPDKRLSYQWKSKLSNRDLSLVESKAANSLVNLGYELSGVPIRGPNWFELTKLFLQNKIYRVKKDIDVYGFSLYSQYLWARKLGISPWEKSLKLKRNAVETRLLK